MSDTMAIMIDAIDACARCGLDAATAGDLRARVTRGESSMLDRAGLVRMLDGCIQDRVFVASPRWALVRALHHAWLAAQSWDFEGEGA